MEAGPRLVDANRLPAEAIRLLDLRERELGPSEGVSSATEREEVRRGQLPGLLWLGPKDDAVALVIWKSVGRSVRKAELYFEPTFRRSGPLRTLVTELRALAGDPWGIVRIPGWSGPIGELGAVLEPIGYRHLARFDMTFPNDRPLPQGPGNPNLRELNPADETDLGTLLAAAYSDFPLDPTYFSPGLTIEEDCRGALRSIFGGELGELRPAASVGVEDRGHLVAAAIGVELRGPLIAEVAVHPEHRRRGLGRAVLRGSLAGFRQHGAAAPRLVVTAANHRARSLYEGFGFQYVPLPEDNTWIDLRAAGRPELVELLPRESS